jgi:hypothetical protein
VPSKKIAVTIKYIEIGIDANQTHPKPLPICFRKTAILFFAKIDT